MFYWLHVGVLRGAKTCRTCGPLIGRLYGKSWQPPYLNPVHRNCRCVWWRIESYPTHEEAKAVVDWWTGYFEWVRWHISGGDIGRTREFLKPHAKNAFGGDFITTEEIPPGPVPPPTPKIIFGVSPFAATIVNEVVGTCPVSETLVSDREYSGIIYDSRLGEPSDSTRAMEAFKLYVNEAAELADAAYLAFETRVHYAFDCARLSSLFAVMSGYDGYLIVNQAQKKFTFVFTEYPE